MLGELQPLGLIVRADAARAIEFVRHLGERLINQPADDLTIFDQIGHVMGAHLQHRPAAAAAGRVMTEARVEKAGVMDPEFATRVS